MRLEKELPSGWKSYNFSEVVFFQEGTGIRKWQFTKSGMKLVNGRNILTNHKIDLTNTDRYVSLEEFKEKYSHFSVENGDILLVSSGSYGKTAIVEEKHLPLMMNTSVIRLHTRDKNFLNNKFLFYYLSSYEFKSQIEKMVTGAAQKNFGPTHLKKTHIKIPPLEVQERIVQILDKAERLKELREESIKKTEVLKSSLIHNEVVEKYYKKKLPVGWEVQRLEKISNQITDGAHRTPNYRDDGIPFYRVTDITKSNTSKKFISKEEHYELIKRCNPEKNDILYSKNGTIGKAKLIDWDFEFSIFVSLCLIKPKTEIVMPSFLENILNSQFVYNQAKNSGKTATVTNLHLVEIKKIKIILPPLEEQKRIVEILDKVEKIKEFSEESSDKLTSSLLQKAFNGEL